MTNLPPLGSTVRIVSIGLPVWPVAEKFIGADCTLCAVFMTGDTQMVAVEHQADLVCCCFVADMVRTPEQAAAHKREAKAKAMWQQIYFNTDPDYWNHAPEGTRDTFRAAIDAGWQKIRS